MKLRFSFFNSPKLECRHLAFDERLVWTLFGSAEDILHASVALTTSLRLKKLDIIMSEKTVVTESSCKTYSRTSKACKQGKLLSFVFQGRLLKQESVC